MCATSNCKIWTLGKTCAVISYLFTFKKKTNSYCTLLHELHFVLKPTSNLESFTATCISLDFWRRQKYLEGIHIQNKTGKRPPADQNRRVQPKTFLLWGDRANHLRHHPMHTSINTAHVWNHLFYSIWFPECAKDWDVSMMWVKNNMRKAVAWLTQTDRQPGNKCEQHVCKELSFCCHFCNDLMMTS